MKCFRALNSRLVHERQKYIEMRSNERIVLFPLVSCVIQNIV